MGPRPGDEKGGISAWLALFTGLKEGDAPDLSRDLLRRVWSYARPYRWYVAGSLITILVITGLSLITPQLFRLMIDVAIPEQDSRQIVLLSLGMMAVPLLSGVVAVYQQRLTALIGQGLIYDLRRDLYGHMQMLSMRFFTNTRTGELMSRLNNDVIGAQTAVNDTIVPIVTNLVKVVATLGIMIVMDWRLTLLSVAILPLFMVPARQFGRRLRVLQRQSLEMNAEMSVTMNETLGVSGALLVKLFGRETEEYARLSRQAADVRDVGIVTAVTARWFYFMISVVAAVGTALVFLFGGQMVLAGSFTVGAIVAFSAYLVQLYGPLRELAHAPVVFAQSMVSFERVFEVLDLPLEIKEADEAVDLGRVMGRVELRDVSFDYRAIGEEQNAQLDVVARYGWRADPSALLKRGKEAGGEEAEAIDQVASRMPARRWAVQDISFVIEPGRMAALVGPSGAGKSTITYLIPRLYDPTRGSIAIDGADIREATLHSLAANIGMVTQDTYLFYDTIRANLLFANPRATVEEIEAAAVAANIHDFISDLPDGYETVVGERGYRLSGGERQRIAIARVILMDPRILVLDEATSALDSLSEALIQEALQRVMAGRTTLVIAHRLSTVLAADRVLVLQEGRLVESGTHAALLAAGGLYTDLYRTQFRVAEETAGGPSSS